MWTALNIRSLFSLPFPSPGTRTTPLPPPRTKPAELQPEGRQRGGDAKRFGTAQKWEFCQGIAIYLTRSNTLDKAMVFFPSVKCCWDAHGLPRDRSCKHTSERGSGQVCDLQAHGVWGLIRKSTEGWEKSLGEKPRGGVTCTLSQIKGNSTCISQLVGITFYTVQLLLQIKANQYFSEVEEEDSPGVLPSPVKQVSG